MNQILALREKRASLWDAAKKYRDAHIGSDGTMTAEDAATYDRMVKNPYEIDTKTPRKCLKIKVFPGCLMSMESSMMALMP